MTVGAIGGLGQRHEAKQVGAGRGGQAALVAEAQRFAGQTDGGRLIQVRSQGLRHGPPEVLARLAAGEPVDPSRFYFRTVLRFETGAGELDWLNRVIAVARGVRLPRAVQLNAFEVL